MDISLIGAAVAVVVSLLSAFFAYRTSIILRTRELKESHYLNYITALHNYTTSNGKNKEAALRYTETRNIIFAIASEDVAVNIIEFEKHAFGCKELSIFNQYLTQLVKSIRKDLMLKNKNLPIINFIQV